MTYFTFAAMLLLAVGAVLSLYRQLQALQKNAYSLSRYFKWVSNSYTVHLAISAIVYCAITFLVLNNKDLFVLILSVLFLAARLALNILTRKKLGFTARIKRLYVTAILLLGVCLFGCIFSFYNLFGEISRMLCIVLSVVSPLLTVVVWLITYPIEKVITKRFANKAKCDSDIVDDNSKGAML
jgi:hypothetical protein